MQKTESENQVNQERIQVSSKGKRLFALLIDFIFALLLANTFINVFREEHWDIVSQTSGFYGLLPFYGGIVLVLFFKDFFGRSLGKILLGMTIKKIDDMEQQPTLAVLIKRNLMLLLFPVEGVVILRDSYARRLADKWWGTVVIDDRNALRGTLRILLGNIILFGFFSIAIISQRSGIEKTAIFQTAEQAIRSHEKLKPILEQYPAIEDPEMHLDLRKNTSNPSMVRARIGNEESGKRVIVSLIFRDNPPGWEVLEVVMEPLAE
ncbi:MAG: hypothetical protein CM1200mP30_02380 [Pseudomonadota bacterium]|jgi:hypothetical protein|nr:MAG: hypothetical protein CM1200mP30_02380 [Pseudomonadota bacterium]